MNQTRIDASLPSRSAALDEATRLSADPSAQSVPAPRGPAEENAYPRLVLRRGPGAGTVFAIGATQTVIGRARDCDIAIDDITVSNRHAAVQRRDGNYVLVDGGSLNGTYLNRSPVDSAVLVDGDEIWIGKARFVYRSED